MEQKGKKRTGPSKKSTTLRAGLSKAGTDSKESVAQNTWEQKVEAAEQKRAEQLFDSLKIVVGHHDPEENVLEFKAKTATINYIRHDLLNGYEAMAWSFSDFRPNELALIQIEARVYYTGYLDGLSGVYQKNAIN